MTMSDDLVNRLLDVSAEAVARIDTLAAEVTRLTECYALALDRAIAAENALATARADGVADGLRMAVNASRQIADQNRDHWREDMAAGADEAADAIFAMLPAPAKPADGWQPIATAPKDGTEILAYWRNFKEWAVVRWSEGEQAWIEGLYGRRHGITRWRPLPAPPAPTEGGEG
jgi:hypothetical protein